MSYDIITFGSATQDVHIKSKAFKILEEGKDVSTTFESGKGICLPFGSKIEVEDIIFTSGGGGTNTAAGFAKQGFRTAFCGAIGADVSGLEIIMELKHLRVDTRFIVKKKAKHTNYSIVMSNNSGERTILAYRGASDMLDKKDIKWKRIKKVKWFYSAPLTGSLLESFGEIVSFAKANNIKVAVNPSKQQLSLPVEEIKNIFSKIDVLFLNQEEASFLTKTGAPGSPGARPGTQIENLSALVPNGVAVITRGADGVVVCDGKYIYSAKPDPERKVVDTTGAGDSFASGFLSDFIRSNGDIEKAIQLGLANSAANLSQVGAKNGLLDKNSEFKRVQVTKIET